MLDDIKVFIHSLDIWVTKTFIKGLSVLKSCLSPNVYFASAYLFSRTETKVATRSVEEHSLKVDTAKHTYLNLGRLLHYMIPNK